MHADDPHIQPPQPTFGPPDVVTPSPAYPPLPVPQLGVPPRPHPNFWWGILWCFGLLLTTQIPGGVVAAVILVVALLLSPGEMQTQQQMMDDPIFSVAIGVAILVAHGLIIVFSLLCLRLIAGRDWARQVALRLPSVPHVGLVLASVPAFIILGGGAYQLLKELGVPTMQDLMEVLMPASGSGQSFDMEAMEKLFGKWPLPLAVFCIGVMPGLSEELWCRAYLGRGIVGRHGYVLGILGTSFLFGAIHVDPRQGSMAVLMGIMLHYVYQMTRSLVAPMLLHFMNNSLAVTLPRIEAIRPLATDQVPPPWHLYVASAVLMIAVCAALYRGRARLVTFAGELAWSPPFPGVACPPPGTATRVAAPRPDAVSVLTVAAGLAAFAASLWWALTR